MSEEGEAGYSSLDHRCADTDIASVSTNLLRYHESHLWIIDVSQSVEHDHPKALEFLRADISHIESYFAKRGGVRNVLGLRKVFDWIIAEPRERAKRGGGNVGIDQVHEQDQGNEEAYEGEFKIVQTGGTGPFAQLEVRERERGESEEELMADLKDIMERSTSSKAAVPSAPPASNGLDHSADAQASSASQRDEQVQAQQQSSDEAVFFSSYIPRTLNEVYDPERDIQKLKKDGAGSLIYAGGVTGLGSANVEQASRPSEQAAASSSQTPAKGEAESGASDDESSEEDGSSDEDDENGETREKKGPRGHRHEDREAKKQRKQEVKSANQERRKTKMSKKEKLKKMKKK